MLKYVCVIIHCNFRGFITYYGKHYMAYFYQEGIDQWIKFDDANVIVGCLEIIISCFYLGNRKFCKCIVETPCRKGNNRPNVFLIKVLFKEDCKSKIIQLARLANTDRS